MAPATMDMSQMRESPEMFSLRDPNKNLCLHKVS